MANTYSIDKDDDGVLVISRERLGATNEGFTLPPSGIHQLAAAMAPKLSYLQQLEAVCMATAIGPAVFLVKGASGGGQLLRTLVTGKINVPGDRYVWNFPTPITNTPTAVFPLRIEVPTTNPSIGFWFVTADGFYSTVPQDT